MKNDKQNEFNIEKWAEKRRMELIKPVNNICTNFNMTKLYRGYFNDDLDNLFDIILSPPITKYSLPIYYSKYIAKIDRGNIYFNLYQAIITCHDSALKNIFRATLLGFLCKWPEAVRFPPKTGQLFKVVLN